MALIKLSASERRRLSAFFTCVVLAVLVWVFYTLSDTYSFTVNEVLVYKNSPQKRAFHPLQADTIKATLKGTGWEILFQKMEYANKNIEVDLKSLESKDYVVLSSQLKQINNRTDFDQPIVSFSPDTLYFDFSGRTVKRVPVNLITGIHYQRQFAQSNNITVEPSYVTVSGPDNVIDNIKSWNTDSLVLDSVNETIRANLTLEPVKQGNLSIYPKSVRVRIPVDEFTEKTVQIPVKLVNNHNFYRVKIFPQKVKITFTTSLRKYPEMDEDFFEAAADLDLWHNRGYSTLPVKLTRYPPYCKIVKIEPQNVDFIIRK
ncbi:CdaR family protein [Mucilaginibacter sp.]|jgi:YbbR domain-containing protein|uniref:CdaR family protein n=1 Tax=Mucilaginibacter sp. TaxID=1882438 RepID=UPI002B9C54C0|nr:CdaR family protein [Mucilaginibacter sp.]HTI57973.1 CdaR family protein [Mucilaginibacter sp.]